MGEKGTIKANNSICKLDQSNDSWSLWLHVMQSLSNKIWAELSNNDYEAMIKPYLFSFFFSSFFLTKIHMLKPPSYSKIQKPLLHPPSLIAYNDIRILITDTPSINNMPRYIDVHV